MQVEPELLAHAEPVAQPQRRAAGDGALALDDLSDVVRRHVELARQSRGRHADGFKLVGEYGTGMNGGRGNEYLLMIVHDLNVRRASDALLPHEPDAPLPVDPDAVLTDHLER